MNKVRQNPNQIMFVPKIIWIALLSSIVVYNYVVYLKIGAEAFSSLPQTENPLLTALVVMALLSFLLSLFLPNIILKSTRKKVKSMEGRISIEIMQAVFMPFILRLIFLESICVYGFILSFQDQSNLILFFSIPVIINYFFIVIDG